MVVHQVRRLLADITGVDAEEITSKTALAKGSGMEPLDVARLVIACEKQFKINIADEDVHTFGCVEDLSAYIDQMLADGLDAPELSDEDRLAWYYE